MDASGLASLWLPPLAAVLMYHAVVQERLDVSVKYPASVNDH